MNRPSCLLSLMKLLLKSCSTKVLLVCPSMEAEYIVMSVACLSAMSVGICMHITCVCFHAHLRNHAHVQTSPNFICMLHTTITQSSFLWRRCDTLWMTRVVYAQGQE